MTYDPASAMPTLAEMLTEAVDKATETQRRALSRQHLTALAPWDAREEALRMWEQIAAEASVHGPLTNRAVEITVEALERARATTATAAAADVEAVAKALQPFIGGCYWTVRGALCADGNLCRCRTAAKAALTALRPATLADVPTAEREALTHILHAVVAGRGYVAVTPETGRLLSNVLGLLTEARAAAQEKPDAG